MIQTLELFTKYVGLVLLLGLVSFIAGAMMPCKVDQTPVDYPTHCMSSKGDAVQRPSISLLSTFELRQNSSGQN
jgi:hypothetical protein